MTDRQGNTLTPEMLDKAMTTTQRYVKYANCLESLHIMASAVMPNGSEFVIKYAVALVWTRTHDSTNVLRRMLTDLARS